VSDDTPSPQSAAHRVAAQLQEYIQREGLEPGDRLGREDELAQRLGTSRIALREALRLLSGTHLIRTSKGPGGGVIVANTFEDGMSRMVSESVAGLLQAKVITPAQLIEARIAIEVPNAGAAALSADAATRAALRTSIEEAQACLCDRSAVVSSGATFHRVIADAAMNRIVGGITAWMFDVLEPELERLQGNRVDDAVVVHQHTEIYDAITAHDAPGAQDAMREHLRYLAHTAQIDI
jgi:DNA-binding FadR family transcriptional regulator